MQKITFEDLPSTNTPINASNLNQIQDNVEDALNKFGKQLWTGSFTSGSITVNGTTDYTVFIVQLMNSVYCIGGKAYGIGGIGTYGSYTTGIFNYRIGGTGNTWTIDGLNKGGSDGTQNQPITAIYGLF